MYVVDEDYMMSIGMELFFSEKNNKSANFGYSSIKDFAEKLKNKPKLKFKQKCKITKEGRRVLDQMKEQAGDVDYEEVRN